jgi:hypothetical protein
MTEVYSIPYNYQAVLHAFEPCHLLLPEEYVFPF